MAIDFSNFKRRAGAALALLLVTLALAVPVEARAAGSLAMFQTKKTKVPPGNWGAAGINLTVDENAARFEFDCAEAEIEQNLLVDKAGNFTADGVYTRRTPGALRTTLPPRKLGARFTGKISGAKMTLRITLVESGEIIGEYTLRRGKKAAIRKCA